MSATEQALAAGQGRRRTRWWRGRRCRTLVEDLHERREKARLGGGQEKIDRQHEAEKLTARERLALLIDEGTFTELGIHGRPHFSQPADAGQGCSRPTAWSPGTARSTAASWPSAPTTSR